MSEWWSPPSRVQLAPGHVHLWRVELDHPPPGPEPLSADERERAARFHFERHRAHFVSGRAWLRHLLARYVGATPEGLRFEYAQYGKPALEGAPLEFNVSHSGALMLLAVAARPVGVDIEKVKPDLEVEDIADRFFSPREVELLLSAPKADRRPLFFVIWARKEAFIKGLGAGLQAPLDAFDVLAPGSRAPVLKIGPGIDTHDRWRLEDVPIDSGYSAALVLDGRAAEIARWRANGAPSFA